MGVEEIRLRKPDAHIVVNSLLPMIDYQGTSGRSPQMADFADFKREKGGATREKIEVDRAKAKFLQAKAAKEANRADPKGTTGQQKQGGQRRQLEKGRGLEQNEER